MSKYNGFHTKNDWENPDVTSINREQAHAPWGAYENSIQAASCDRNVSKWVKCLDGLWKFAYYSRPADVGNFWDDGFDHTGWNNVKVPGNWELQGFGEPIYTNFVYPWAHSGTEKHIIYPNGFDGALGLPNPPHVPPENPTGCYYRQFEIDSEWLERDIFIHFKGVETAYYLWINGQEVGYSQDSKLPSEFDITGFLKEGKNSVAVQVMRFADSSYLEDQDYWFLSGIFRPVSLFAKPKARIVDWKIDAVPDLHYSFGTVEADVSINRFNGFANYKVKLDILDAQDRLLASGTSGIASKALYRNDLQPTSNTARFHLKADDIVQWTPETPALYKAVITLISPDGYEVDFESSRIGFRKIEIVNGVILLNGKRLIVRGVNRHEHEVSGGRTVSAEHMAEEIKLMKRLGINSVRTCHYPDDPVWYDLCDEWGILLICECNLETHGVMGELTHNPAWGTNFLERAIRMVLTHKNHPSVYSWSLGNESGTGANHAGMAGWIREYDPTRLCQYEAGTPGKNISDVRGNMYATQKTIMQMLTDKMDTRPVVLVEYLYQIRNAGGGMFKFHELVENYERFQGGYIWDWQDKCLVAKTPEGKEFFGYGGDLGESLVDWLVPYFMTNNGIVLPDLALKPVALEVKQIYCPIVFEEDKSLNPWDLNEYQGTFLIKNRNMVSDTKLYTVTYTVRENGCAVKTGPFELPYLKARETAKASFNADVEKKPNSEYHVEFSVCYAKDTAYAKKGYELGCYQFKLDSGACRYVSSVSTAQTVGIEEKADVFKVTGADFSVSFDKNSGVINSYIKNGAEYLASGPVECLTRPLSGLDAGENWGRYSVWAVFDSENSTAELKKITCETLGNSKAVVETEREISFKSSPYGIIVLTTYTVNGSGDIKVNTVFKIDASLKELPRVGMEMAIPEGFETLEYFGFGPVENYRDRRHCAKLGVFKSSVESEHFAFIPPSECGGHEETRYVTLINGQGRSLKISSHIPFHFDVHHNTIDDYKNAKHEHELIRRKESYLHIDAAHSGIGGDMGWSTILADCDKAKAQNYSLEFTIYAG